MATRMDQSPATVASGKARTGLGSASYSSLPGVSFMPIRYRAASTNPGDACAAPWFEHGSYPHNRDCRLAGRVTDQVTLIRNASTSHQMLDVTLKTLKGFLRSASRQPYGHQGRDPAERYVRAKPRHLNAFRRRIIASASARNKPEERLQMFDQVCHSRDCVDFRV